MALFSPDMNKPSVTKIEAADRVKFCIVLAAVSESKNLENLPNACILAQIYAIS